MEFTKERLLVISFNIKHLECSKDTDGNERTDSIDISVHWTQSCDEKPNLQGKHMLGGSRITNVPHTYFLKESGKLFKFQKFLI